METLLNELIAKAGQAQVVRMFKNSALDGAEKLLQLEREISEIKTLILLQAK